MADNIRWFVIHTYSGYENKVASNILTVTKNRKMEDQILEVCIPTETVLEIKQDNENDLYDEMQDEAADYVEGFSEDDANTKRKTQNKPEKREYQRKLYPGYVFVKLACVYKDSDEYGSDDELTMTDEAWYVIRNTRGVTGFVGPGSKPVPLSDDEVKKLGIEVKAIEVDYKVGDFVNIISGPFDGYEGIVEAIDLSKESVTVRVAAFTVEVALDQVKPAV